MSKTHLEIDHLFETRSLMEVKVAPNGRQAVLLVRTPNAEEQRNDYSLWLWREGAKKLRRLTKGPADRSPVWVDNDTILFTATKREADEEKGAKKPPKTRLYTISTDGGEPEHAATLDGVLWAVRPSPRDGRTLAIVFSENPKRSDKEIELNEKAQAPVVPLAFPFRLDGTGLLPEQSPGLFLLALDGKKPKPRRLAQEHGFWYSRPAWTPDGKAVVVQRSDESKLFARTELWLVSTSGKARELPCPGGASGPHAVSPDGTQLAFCMNMDQVAGHTKSIPLNVRSLDPADPSWREVARTGGRIGFTDVLSDIAQAADDDFLHWMDSNTIIALNGESGIGQLVQVELDKPGELTLRGGIDGHINVAGAAGQRVLYVSSSPTNPGELYLLGEDDPQSDLNKAVAKRYRIRPTRFQAVSEPDVHIDTWLWATEEQLATRKRASLPLVVYVHGGPAAQAGEAPMHEYAWLAENGFPVAISNPRGSTGYGDEHGSAIFGDWGEKDVRDILAVREEALRRHPQFDPERTFIVGGSYGGYMTNMMLTRHPGLFRAGITQRSICNHLSFGATSDFPLVFARIALGIDTVFADPQRAWDKSPLAQIQNVVDPLLVIHSDNDLRCPLSQADELVGGLVAVGRKLGEDVRYVIFRGESHGLSRGGRPENRRRRLLEILGWLQKHNTPRDGAGRAKRKARAAK
ncbi:MAG: S9 family peptidase [Candidatus Sumerlaeia bacterium]|nr:S9 family peptidase [Candidatus Sumerlaeia bacterium]